MKAHTATITLCDASKKFYLKMEIDCKTIQKIYSFKTEVLHSNQILFGGV